MGWGDHFDQGEFEMHGGYIMPSKQAVRNCVRGAVVRFIPKDMPAETALGIIDKAADAILEGLDEYKNPTKPPAELKTTEHPHPPIS